jgi:hypothetical protein
MHKGSHGTTMTRAGKIISSGNKFEFGFGRRGEGAYFWRYSKFFMRLGIAWYHQAKSEQRYSGDHDSSGVVLVVELDCDPENLLDLLNYDLKERVENLVAGLKTDGNLKKISKAYDFAFSEIERSTGLKIKLIRVEITPPKYTYISHFFDLTAFSTVPCLITRDNSIITSVKPVLEKDVSD